MHDSGMLCHNQSLCSPFLSFSLQPDILLDTLKQLIFF